MVGGCPVKGEGAERQLAEQLECKAEAQGWGGLFFGVPLVDNLCWLFFAFSQNW